MIKAKLKIVHICKTQVDHLEGFGMIMSVFQTKELKDWDPYVNFSFE